MCIRDRAQVDWQRARNGWAVEPDWILDSPGVVGSIRIAINLSLIHI